MADMRNNPDNPDKMSPPKGPPVRKEASANENAANGNAGPGKTSNPEQPVDGNAKSDRASAITGARLEATFAPPVKKEPSPEVKAAVAPTDSSSVTANKPVKPERPVPLNEVADPGQVPDEAGPADPDGDAETTEPHLSDKPVDPTQPTPVAKDPQPVPFDLVGERKASALRSSAAWLPLGHELTGEAPDLEVPLECFPGFIAVYIRALAKAVGAPEGYVAAMVLMIAASAIGHSCVGRAGPEWTVPAIIWMLLVGGPGANKSPAMKRTLKPLLKIEAEMRQPYRDVAYLEVSGKARADLLATAEEMGVQLPGATKIPRGPEPQLVAQGLTLPGVEDAVADFPRGFLLTRDEIVSLTKTKNSDLRGILLSSIDGGLHRRRSGKGSTDLPRLGLWIVGGIQPDVLVPLLTDLKADGMGARYFPIVGHIVQIEEMPEPVDDGPFEDILRRILALQMEDTPFGAAPREIPFSHEAQTMIFRRNQANRLSAGRESGIMMDVMAKSVGTIARLALILGVLRATAAREDPDLITVDDVTHAMTLFDTYLLPMSRAAYGRQSWSALEKAAHDVIDKLRVRAASEVTLREAKRMVAGSGWTDADRQEVVIWLESKGVLRWLGATPSGPQGGAPSPRYAVHPQIWSADWTPEA